MEPLAGNRTITIAVSDSNSTSTVSITLQVELVNNHNPVVDLNGRNVDGLNYSTSINFNYVSPNRAAIATPLVTISDDDTDAYINKLEIRLNEESRDYLVLNLSNCTLPPDLAQTSCQIRWDLISCSYFNNTYIFYRTDPQFSCVCNGTPLSPQDLTTLAVNLTQKAIIVIQQQDQVSFEIFQNFLATVVWFKHNPTPPSNSYTSVVSVVAFDGLRYSQPANTTVTVHVTPSEIVPILGEVIIINYTSIQFMQPAVRKVGYGGHMFIFNFLSKRGNKIFTTCALISWKLNLEIFNNATQERKYFVFLRPIFSRNILVTWFKY